MAKRISYVFGLVIMLCLVLAGSAYAESKIMILKIGDSNMSVNGVNQEIDPGRGTKPLIIKGTTLVPIRTIIDNMGGSIAWNQDTRQITISANNKTILMTLDYINAEIKENEGTNWTTKKLAVAPQSINGRTMVPLRFVTEELGAAVAWEGTTRTITITLGATEFDPLSWKGTWETDNGILNFNQVGNNVATVNDVEYFGKITGTVSGKTLTGKWFQDVSNQGDIILTLSDDGKWFTGKHNYNSPGNPFTPDPDDPEAGWFSVSGQR